MGYADPMQSITYTYANIDFGAGDKAASFQGPKGMTGQLRAIIMPNVTETFTNTTLEAHILIGTAGNNDAYADAKLGVTPATDTFEASQDYPAWLIEPSIPADTQVEVAFVAPTGGTPAGIADVQIVVDWF